MFHVQPCFRNVLVSYCYPQQKRNLKGKSISASFPLLCSARLLSACLRSVIHRQSLALWKSLVKCCILYWRSRTCFGFVAFEERLGGVQGKEDLLLWYQDSTAWCLDKKKKPYSLRDVMVFSNSGKNMSYRWAPMSQQIGEPEKWCDRFAVVSVFKPALLCHNLYVWTEEGLKASRIQIFIIYKWQTTYCFLVGLVKG